MNKENTVWNNKCTYCSNQANGIIYRPNNQISNVFACTSHATNLFIPFHNMKCDKKQLQQSRYRSPLKASQISNQSLTQQTPLQPNPEPFFDRLMENIIEEFNTMKKQVMTNYNSMMKLQRNEQALRFRMQGDPSYPYMIINQDQDMMMNGFVNRLLAKNSLQNERIRRQKIIKRRMQLSTMISNQNLSTKTKSPFTKDTTSVILSRSIEGSPYRSHQQSIDKPSTQTQRRNVSYRDYCKTQKRQKK